MEKLGDILPDYFIKVKKPSSKRAYIIQTICETLFSDKDFSKILGQTKNFTEQEIEDIFNEAKNWDVNPQALFWKLVRVKKEEIKNSLSG